MEKLEIIKNITERTGGELYLGVVGAVRTGKSTFIKKVIENLVVPNIEDEYEKEYGPNYFALPWKNSCDGYPILRQ